MGNRNRKASRDEMGRARKVIAKAFPDEVAVFGAHGDYGGHRAPRTRTISFRLRSSDGRFCSNVVWLTPDQLAALTVESVRAMMRRSNGHR